MGGFWRRRLGLAPWAGCVLAVSCASAPRNDLATNEQIYRSPGYRARMQGDRPVFLAPVQDQRGPVAVEASGSPVTLMDDGRWKRPVARMLDDVFADELARNGVFPRVLKAPSAGACVLEPAVVRFHGGIIEEITGRSTFADVALRVRVHGPTGSQGRRTLLLDKTFEHRQVADTRLSPVSPMLLLGLATSRVLGQVDAALDQSNASRSGMLPLEVPTEAGRDGGR